MSSTTIKFVASDFLDAWRLQRRTTLLVRVSVFAPLVLLALYLLSSWRDIADYGWEAVVSDPVLPILIIFLTTLNVVNDKVLLPRRAKRLLGQQKSMQEDVAVAWNDAGIEFTMPNGHHRLAWTDFMKWRESPTVLLMFQAENLMNILPKRCLSDEQAAEIRDRLTVALGKAGKARK